MVVNICIDVPLLYDIGYLMLQGLGPADTAGMIGSPVSSSQTRREYVHVGSGAAVHAAHGL